MNEKFLVVLKGIGAAFLGGTISGVSLLVIDPNSFTVEGLRKFAFVILASAVTSVIFYLKKSPIITQIIEKPVESLDISKTEELASIMKELIELSKNPK